MNLGIAFQLVDDLLDFVSTEEALGKPAGADLVEGKVSLPLIFLLQRIPEHRGEVQRVIAEGNYTRVSRASLLNALESSGSLALAQARAVEYAEAARAALNGLNDSAYANALTAIPTYIVERDR